MHEQITRSARRDLDAVPVSELQEFEVGDYSEHDEQGRPGKLVMKVKYGNKEETKFISLFRYDDATGEMEELIFTPRRVRLIGKSEVKLATISPEALIAGKIGDFDVPPFPPSQRRVYTKPLFAGDFLGRPLKRTEFLHYRWDGRTATQIIARNFGEERKGEFHDLSDSINVREKPGKCKTDKETPGEWDYSVHLANGHESTQTEPSEEKASATTADNKSDDEDNLDDDDDDDIPGDVRPETPSPAPTPSPASASPTSDSKPADASPRMKIAQQVQDLLRKRGAVLQQQSELRKQQQKLLDEQHLLKKIPAQLRSSAIGIARDMASGESFCVTARNGATLPRLQDLTIEQKDRFSQWVQMLSDDPSFDGSVLIKNDVFYRVDPVLSAKFLDSEIQTVQQRLSAMKNLTDELQDVIDHTMGALEKKPGIKTKVLMGLRFFVGAQRWDQWAQSAQMIREFSSRSEAELRWGAIREETLIHRGTISRFEWIFKMHQDESLTNYLSRLAAVALMWPVLIGLTAVIVTGKLIVSIRYPFDAVKRDRALRSVSAGIHINFNLWIWRPILLPIEVTVKTVLFRASNALGVRPTSPLARGLKVMLQKLFQAPLLSPALATLDYRAQTSRKELKFGVVEGPDVDAVLDELDFMGLVDDPEFAAVKERFPLGYPVNNIYLDYGNNVQQIMHSLTVWLRFPESEWPQGLRARLEALLYQMAYPIEPSDSTQYLAEKAIDLLFELDPEILKKSLGLQQELVQFAKFFNWSTADQGHTHRQYELAEERNDLESDRVKCRIRGYEPGAKSWKLEIKDTEKIARKKKSFSIERDRMPDIYMMMEKVRMFGFENVHIDFSVLSKRHSTKDQEYFIEWLKLTKNMVPVVVEKYWRLAKEVAGPARCRQRSRVARECGLRRLLQTLRSAAALR